MKFMISLQSLLALSVDCKALQVSRTSFTGLKCINRRSFARQSPIIMMPEGPEVRTVVDQLQGSIGARLIDIQFLSGRYVRHGRPTGFQEFANTMSPIASDPQTPKPEAIDTIQEWTAKGKFIYLRLDRGKMSPQDDTDFARSIWVTLGMTGHFVNEETHQRDPRFARWYVEFLDLESGSTKKIYFNDQRNFGTLKFCLSQEELDKKLKSIGPDFLDPATSEETFLERMKAASDDMNICKFLMNQNVCRHRYLISTVYV